MKPALTWSYRPYSPPFHEIGDPYLCRIAPGKDSVTLEWLGSPEGEYRVKWGLRGESGFTDEISVRGTSVTFAGLEEGRDYACAVFCADTGSRSRIRLFRTGEAVGTVVNYLHPDDEAYAFSGRYLCSPCIVRHPDGHLLASMDLFAGDAPQNLSMIFRSDDDGATWHWLTDLFPCFSPLCARSSSSS